MIKFVLINGLTLLRLPLSLVFCMMVLMYDHPFLPCILLFIVIGASDYLDGKLAWKFQAQTDIGAKLDVAADFFFILMACLSWAYLNLFPVWMVGIILMKFIEFLITSAISKKKSKTVFKFDPLGRIAAVLFYLLPVGVLLLLHYGSDSWQMLALNLICIAITVLAVSSSFLRIGFLIKTRKEYIE